MASKDGRQLHGLSKMDLLLQTSARFWWYLGHLICFPENIISLCSDDISITYYFSPICNDDFDENHLSETSSLSLWSVFKIQQGNCSILLTFYGQNHGYIVIHRGFRNQ